MTRRVFAPPTLPGERPYGCFADANCARAFLETRKPRGWKRRLRALLQNSGVVEAAPAEGWTLGDPRRVIPSHGCIEDLPPSRPAPAAAVARKRKRGGAPPPVPPSEPPLPPPPVAAAVAAPATATTRVVINDETGVRRVFNEPGDWRRVISNDLGYPMDHAMPVFFRAGGREFTLYPLLECDGKHIAASDVTVTVTLPPTAGAP